jgi:hypothetical protein
MDDVRKMLHFLWWNVQDFAHFEPDRAANQRWPSSPEAFLEKRQRVEHVLRQVSQRQLPHLLAFAEITDRALHDVRDALFPDYNVHALGSLYAAPDFHLGLLYDPALGFADEDFLAVANLPDTARPMAILDYCSEGNHIRFYACHWTARFTPQSEKWRSLSARTLGIEVYRFLHPDRPVDEKRHVVILGDLNEEPFGILEEWLYASRDRRRSRERAHYTDTPIHRIRLYNCSWRLLGERFPHPSPPEERETAGTYYWRDERTWHTSDQVIVSGTLLSTSPPFLDEHSLRVACDRDELPGHLLGADGLPCKFDWTHGNPRGLSDHLPLCGSIVLAQE